MERNKPITFDQAAERLPPAAMDSLMETLGESALDKSEFFVVRGATCCIPPRKEGPVDKVFDHVLLVWSDRDELWESL
jgi:hypothetical protein